MAGQGAFAGFSLDAERPDRFGWKSFPMSEITSNEGSLSHAYCERTVLDYLTQYEELHEYIAKVEKASIHINGKDVAAPGAYIPQKAKDDTKQSITLNIKMVGFNC